jgi:hypothetical protein
VTVHAHSPLAEQEGGLFTTIAVDEHHGHRRVPATQELVLASYVSGEIDAQP